MAESPEKEPRRVIELTSLAEDDRLVIHIYTEQQGGVTQADNYNAFLQKVFQRLADTPGLAPIIPTARKSGLRMYVAYWKNARQGHRIVFKETENGIRVMRILHTSMNWPQSLG